MHVLTVRAVPPGAPPAALLGMKRPCWRPSICGLMKVRCIELDGAKAFFGSIEISNGLGPTRRQTEKKKERGTSDDARPCIMHRLVGGRSFPPEPTNRRNPVTHIHHRMLVTRHSIDRRARVRACGGSPISWLAAALVVGCVWPFLSVGEACQGLLDLFFVLRVSGRGLDAVAARCKGQTAAR